MAATINYNQVNAFTSLAAATTFYIPVGSGGASNYATETFAQVKAAVAGSMTKLYINVLTNDRGAGTLKLRNASGVGGYGSESVAITASTTGDFTDTTNTDSIAANDIIDIELVTGAGGTTFTRGGTSVIFAATTDSSTFLSASGGGTTVSGSNIFFFTANSANSGATETAVQIYFRTAGTLTYLNTGITINTRTVVGTVKTRIDTGGGSADGNNAVSITASTTGYFDDTAHTDTVASGDKLNYVYYFTTGTGNIGIGHIGCNYKTTSGSGVNIGYFSPAGGSANANTTYYLGIGGVFASTTESNHKAVMNAAGTFSKFVINVATNTVSANSSFISRIDTGGGSANGGCSATITANTTGYFEDTTGSDTVAATDHYNTAAVMGATGTSAALKAVSLLFTASGGTPASVPGNTIQFLQLLGIGT